MEKFERITKFRPAFDKRHKDPAKNYGIHCVECFMVLKGEKGAVDFMFFTGMYLPETIKEMAEKGELNAKTGMFSDGYFSINKPMGVDVGYHSLTPRYDGQEISQKNCCWLNDRPCYYDGSAMRGSDWMDILLREGSDKIWELLEAEYHALFK